MFAILGQILIGWLLADFLSGLIHWWMDGANPRIPLIGKLVIEPNILHHSDPLAFTRSSFIKRNLPLAFVVGLISFGWIVVLGFSWVWVATTVLAALSGEIHYLTHTAKSPGLILRCLRATGLIQSPGVHARHHRAPNRSTYCVVTNWLNTPLDDLGFWRVLDRLTGRTEPR